jgi:hypothetical protein
MIDTKVEKKIKDILINKDRCKHGKSIREINLYRDCDFNKLIKDKPGRGRTIKRFTRLGKTLRNTCKDLAAYLRR